MKKIFIIIFIPIILCSCARKRTINKIDLFKLDKTTFVPTSLLKFKSDTPNFEWWENFNDPILTGLINKAVASNLDLRIAMYNINKSRAGLRLSKTDRWPNIDSNASYKKQRLSENNTAQVSDRDVKTFSAGFDASWEIDLFSRTKQKITSAKAELVKTKAEYRGMYLVVVAEIAKRYIELRGAQYLLDILQQKEKNYKKQFDVVTEMANQGIGTNLDIAQATMLLEQARSEIPLQEANIRIAIYRLSVLVGELPDFFMEKLSVPRPLPSIPETVCVGQAKDLLRRRPDIIQAEQEVIKATASYNLSVAELYPEININGTLGFVSSFFTGWISDKSMQTSICPMITWRIFDLARVDAEIFQSDYNMKSKIYTFRKTVLEALEDVESSFIGFGKSEINRQSLIKVAKASQDAVEIANMRFREGKDNVLDFLDIERNFLQAKYALVQAETRSAINIIRIYKALGGEWEVL